MANDTDDYIMKWSQFKNAMVKFKELCDKNYGMVKDSDKKKLEQILAKNVVSDSDIDDLINSLNGD